MISEYFNAEHFLWEKKNNLRRQWGLQQVLKNFNKEEIKYEKVIEKLFEVQSEGKKSLKKEGVVIIVKC